MAGFGCGGPHLRCGEEGDEGEKNEPKSKIFSLQDRLTVTMELIAVKYWKGGNRRTRSACLPLLEVHLLYSKALVDTRGTLRDCERKAPENVF